MPNPKHKWDFRDVSVGLKIIREFLLGRKHTLHGRFPPLLSSRSIPRPDIPRGPENINKYSEQYYIKRHAMNSVAPPIVAPVAEGPAVGVSPIKIAEHGRGLRPETLHFNCAPTPGNPWWWDGHSYYEIVPDPSAPPKPPLSPCPTPDPCPPKPDKFQ